MQNDKSDKNCDKEQVKEDDTKADEQKPTEIGGREGPDPVRYGDWENNGIASDF